MNESFSCLQLNSIEARQVSHSKQEISRRGDHGLVEQPWTSVKTPQMFKSPLFVVPNSTTFEIQNSGSSLWGLRTIIRNVFTSFRGGRFWLTTTAAALRALTGVCWTLPRSRITISSSRHQHRSLLIEEPVLLRNNRLRVSIKVVFFLGNGLWAAKVVRKFICEGHLLGSVHTSCRPVPQIDASSFARFVADGSFLFHS